MPEKFKQYYLSREQNKDAPVLNQKSMDMFDGERVRPWISSLSDADMSFRTLQVRSTFFISVTAAVRVA